MFLSGKLFKKYSVMLITLNDVTGENKFMGAFGQQQICHNAQIGIAIELEANVQHIASSLVGISLLMNSQLLLHIQGHYVDKAVCVDKHRFYYYFTKFLWTLKLATNSKKYVSKVDQEISTCPLLFLTILKFLLNVTHSTYQSLSISHFQTDQTSEYLSFAQKMLENLVNFVASFTVTQEQMTPTPGVAYIPLSTLHTWYQNFERRLQQNPNFWKN